MKKVSLLFGIHMHQPVDNFGLAVDEAIELCYKPFFETMVNYPEFKFSVHSSGWLLDKIRTEHSELFEKIHFLTKQGAIEWMSAGYYEPVLSSIPSKDRIAQITKLNKYLKKYFGVKPKGLWLTERVWESALIPDLSECGIEYAVLDDYHFLSSGFSPYKMDGYYTTEEGAKELNLFPIAKSLRYALPFFSVKRSLDAIMSCGINENSAAIIFDDAEKFGLWPKTHEWVYEKRWLEEFVEAVLAHKQIKPMHYSEYMRKNHSLGIAYLSNTSYFEMGEWSLRYEQGLALEELKHKVGEDYFNTVGVAFIKGGIWKNFFVKYDESNYLHKRMLYFSTHQESLSPKVLESLYKLQTNDVFWHGVFGGLYLPNLRDNAYRYLLEIEQSKAGKEISSEVLDIDKDGFDELKVLTPSLSLVFSSRYGGAMVEFGSLSKLFNWQNTLMRRKEAYHEKIFNPVHIEHRESRDDEIATIHHDAASIDPSLKDELVYDWHPKYSFIDHFSLHEFSLHHFRHLSFGEVGDFANQPFVLNKKRNSFSREGGIYLEQKYDAKMKKKYSFTADSITLNTKFQTEYENLLHYAQEFNFHFAHPHKVTLNERVIEEGFFEENTEELVIFDDYTNTKLILRTSSPCNIYAYVLNTVSQSESGFEKMAQGISLILTKTFENKITLKTALEIVDV